MAHLALHPLPLPAAELNRRVCGALSLLLMATLVIGRLIEAHLGADLARPVLHVAVVAAVLMALLRLGAVARIAQVFMVAAVLAIAGIALLAPAAMPRLQGALLQGAAFSAFLTSLGLIRAPVRASKVIGKAASWLFSAPPGRRIMAVELGTQFISVLFNVGTIGMMHDIARADAARRPDSGLDVAAIPVAAMRGAAAMTIWSPIGVGFAIVTSGISGLDPVRFLLLSFAAAFLAALICAFLFRPGRKIPKAQKTAIPAPAGSGRALLSVLGAIGALIAITIGVHRLLDISFLTAAVMLLPLVAFLWPRLEPAARSSESPIAGLAAASEGMANEATIFLAASVVAGVLGYGAQQIGVDRMIAAGDLPALVVILAALVAIPTAAALFIPHSVVMILCVQVFGAGPIGAAHPYALALALCFAWGIAICASPISAMSIITSRLKGCSTQTLAFQVNRPFTLAMLAMAAAAVGLTYLLE